MPASNVGKKGDVLTKASDQSGDWTWAPVTSDHGELTGLLDDDHPQYYNEDRLEEWFSSKDTDGLTEGDTNLYNRVPPGGTTNQVLTKIDGTDYNTQWAAFSGSGGVTFHQDSEPVGATQGNTWYNSLTGTFHVYSDSQWKSLVLDGEHF